MRMGCVWGKKGNAEEMSRNCMKFARTRGVKATGVLLTPSSSLATIGSYMLELFARTLRAIRRDWGKATATGKEGKGFGVPRHSARSGPRTRRRIDLDWLASGNGRQRPQKRREKSPPVLCERTCLALRVPSHFSSESLFLFFFTSSISLPIFKMRPGKL